MTTQTLSGREENRWRWLLAGLALFVAATTAQPVQAQAGASTGQDASGEGAYLNLQPYLAVPPFDVKAFPRRRAEPRPLFQAPLRPDRNATVDATRPRVVCGMTVVPGNPAVDPGITARMTPPEAQPALRAIVPSMCGDTRQP